jgi:acyl transferase domain-containing protein
MEPVVPQFEVLASEVTYFPPRIDLISNLTGTRVSDEMIGTSKYWCQHLCQPVQFAAGMETLSQLGYQVYLEVGPQPVLLSMGRQCLSDGQGIAWLPSLRRGRSDWRQMLTSLADLYAHGAAVDWREFYRDQVHRRLPLPMYPFQRQRYWVAAESDCLAIAPPQDWFYEVRWQPKSR